MTEQSQAFEYCARIPRDGFRQGRGRSPLFAAIETHTSAAVQATKRVSETIGRVEAATEEIAAAMAQQRATTDEIARSAQEAARGTRDVSANVGTVTGAMTEAEAGARRMISTADQVALQSRDLTDRIASFLGSVRAA